MVIKISTRNGKERCIFLLYDGGNGTKRESPTKLHASKRWQDPPSTQTSGAAPGSLLHFSAKILFLKRINEQESPFTWKRNRRTARAVSCPCVLSMGRGERYPCPGSGRGGGRYPCPHTLTGIPPPNSPGENLGPKTRGYPPPQERTWDHGPVSRGTPLLPPVNWQSGSLLKQNLPFPLLQ